MRTPTFLTVEACEIGIQQSEWSRAESDRVPEKRRKQKGSGHGTERLLFILLCVDYHSFHGFDLNIVSQEMSLVMSCKCLFVNLVL
jgi:hypothetical protein